MTDYSNINAQHLRQLMGHVTDVNSKAITTMLSRVMQLATEAAKCHHGACIVDMNKLTMDLPVFDFDVVRAGLQKGLMERGLLVVPWPRDATYSFAAIWGDGNRASLILDAINFGNSKLVVK